MNNHFIYSFSYLDGLHDDEREVTATVIFCDLPQIHISNLQEEIKAFYERHYQTDKIYVIGGSFLTEEMKRVFIDEKDTTFIGIPKRQDTHLDENLHLITFDSNGNLNCLGGAIPEGFRNKFLNEGLQQIFLSRGGLVSSGEAHHFVFPSGKHSDKFLRTGNILLHSCEINFIAYALLQHFDESKYDQIYCDSSSINSVALSLVQLKNRFFGKEQQKMVPISSFSSYEGLYKNDLSYGKNALLLISASTSANILNYILGNHRIISRSNVVILYFLGEEVNYHGVKDKVLCNLTQSVENENGIPFYKTYKEQDCELCKRGSYPVEVSGDVFLLENPIIKPLLLMRADGGQKLSNFMRLFKSVGQVDSVLKVNYKENGNQGEKYEVYIDLYQVLAGFTQNRYKGYQEKLHNFINQYVPSNTRYIVSLNDGASQELSKYILGRIGNNYQADHMPNIVTQDELIEKIPENAEGTVVVVGSCISNGKNLLYISRALRGHDKLRIVYFIGVSRTRNEEYLEQLKKNLKQGQYGGDTYTFVTVEAMYCNNNSYDTPWIKEIEFLKSFINFIQNEMPEATNTIRFLKNRRRMLELSGGDDKRGLAQNLFYPKAFNHQEELVLRKNFAFFNFSGYENDVTQSDVFFTISNILNSLRNTSSTERNLRQSAYVRNLLDIANFSRFNDGIIQASLLRAARPEELAYANNQELSQEMYGTLETLINYHESDQGEALLEFIYAIASKQMSLKKSHLEGVVKLLKEKCSEELVLCFCEYISFSFFKEDSESSKENAGMME